MKLIYQFSAGRSLLHRLDPRTKIFWVAVLLVLSLTTAAPWWLFLAIVVLLYVCGRISPLQYWHFLVLMLPLMVAVLVVHRSVRGLEIGFRLITMGTAFLGFAMTTDPFDLGVALHRSGLPYRVSFMFAFAMRFLPLLQEEMSIIQNALRARGYHGIRTVAFAALPLGIGALRRSQKIALSMEMRGFSYAEEAGITRTILRDVHMRRRDWVALACGALVMVVTLGYWAFT